MSWTTRGSSRIGISPDDPSEAYPTLDEKAAALLHSIVTGHSLVDGNKRLGWVALRLFYRLNGTDVEPPADDAFAHVVAIADGAVSDVEAIAGRLATWRSTAG